MTFVDSDSGHFSEQKYNYGYFGDVNSFPVAYDDVRIIDGFTNDDIMGFVIYDEINEEFIFRLYQRYYWFMFFDLSNINNNMKNIKLINSDWTPYIIKSLDMFYDGTTDNYVIYIACVPKNPMLASLTKLTLNQIRFPKRLA